MDKKAKTLLIGSGIAAAGVLSAGHCALTRYFVNIALDRQIPRHPPGSQRLLTGAAKDPACQQAIRDAALALERRCLESVTIQGRDGTVLAGHWYSAPQARRVILAMHGWRSSWSHDFGLIAPFWFANGCSVLFAEQRGQGESGGAYMGFGLLERYDCLDWIQWINRQTDPPLPVYLGGISMGASTVLMAAGEPLPPNVRGIVADCGYSSPGAIWCHVARHNLHLLYGSRRAAADRLCRKKLRIGIGDFSCPDALARCPVPVLLIHGTDDPFVPVEMTYENYKACAGPRRLLIVPGAGHGMSYLTDRAGYEAALLRFWEDFDP